MPADSDNMHTLLNPKRRSSAFSLIEVVIAVGIFAISIVAVIGLLGPTNKSVADVHDTDDATRVVNAIQSQLQTRAQTSIGWNTVISYLDGPSLYASRDGTRIGLTGDSIWSGTNPSTGEVVSNFNGLKFFQISLLRNTALSPVANDDATSNTAAGFLAYTIRLSWPAYLPDGTVLADTTQQNVLLVPAAVHR